MDYSIEVMDIQERIITLRGVQVMLDRDLAELYGVQTKRLNEQVKRNAARLYVCIIRHRDPGTGRKMRPVQDDETFHSSDECIYRAWYYHVGGCSEERDGNQGECQNYQYICFNAANTCSNGTIVGSYRGD